MRGYPGYQSAPALNPAKGFTPCAQGRAGDSARGQMDQSKEAVENPRDNHLPIPKGLNRCGGVGLMPRGFGETLVRVGRRVHPGAQGTLPIETSDQQQKLPSKPYAHGVQPIAGLSATRWKTQGSLASSATLGSVMERLRRNSHVRCFSGEQANLSHPSGMALRHVIHAPRITPPFLRASE